MVWLNFFMEKNSDYAHMMKNNLDMSEKEADEFSATFYTSAAWGRPVKRLKNAERFHFCGLMAPEKFTAFWKKIST